MLELKNYILKFDNKIVFDNTYFKANDNQLTLITGESGVGKTTCLQSLLLNNVYKGDYTYHNQKVNEEIIRDNFYFIEQFRTFIEDLDIESHFLMIEENFKNLDYYQTLEKLKIENLLKKYPNQLSDGEKKRISLALAFFMNREVLIADEPTSSLNEEFSRCVCELLKEYAMDGHMVIASGHDHMLREYADVIYEIEYNQFKYLQDKDYEVIKNHASNNIKIRVRFIDYLKMYRHSLKRHIMVKILMMILVSVVGFAFVFNNEAIRVNIDAINEISSTEILVFKSVDGKGMFDYSYVGNEFPLSTEEVKALQNIDHVSYINYKYDIEISNDCNEKVKIGTRNTADVLKKLSAKQNGVKLEKKYPEDFDINQMTIQTYDSNYDYGSKVKEKISDKKGIYISQSLFNILFQNIDDHDLLTLYLPIQIPIYNVSGISVTQAEDDTSSYETNCVATKEIWTELPIVGILSGDSLYDNYDNQIATYDIFLEQGILEKYIEQYKDVKSHVMYYTGDFGNTKIYYDELPPDGEEIRQTIKMTPWTPNCYIIHLDNLGYLEDVLTEINKMGLDAKNVYINTTSLKSAVASTQMASKILAVGIAILLLCMGYSVKSKETNEKDMNKFLNNLGANKKEILLIKVKKYVLNFVIQTIVTLIASFVLVKLLAIMFPSGTKYSFDLVMIMIGITFIIEFAFALVMERKWLKNVRTS